MLAIAKSLNEKYGEGTIEITIEDSYYNMKEKVMEKPELVSLVHKAMLKNNVTPLEMPIRGGTDGARLSFEGIPCPNLGTGGENFHGPLEYLDVNDFLQMIEIIKSLSLEIL